MAALNRGVPSVAIEFPRSDLMNEETYTKFSKGLRNLLAHFGVTGEEPRKPETSPMALDRSISRSLRSALWMPHYTELMAAADKGSSIGSLIDVEDFSRADIEITSGGILTGFRPREVVKVDDILFSTGSPLPEVSSMLEEIREEETPDS